MICLFFLRGDYLEDGGFQCMDNRLSSHFRLPPWYAHLFYTRLASFLKADRVIVFFCFLLFACFLPLLFFLPFPDFLLRSAYSHGVLPISFLMERVSSPAHFFYSFH